MDEPKNQEELAAEFRQRQRNTVFPHTLAGGTSVDVLLWRGDPKAPRVQRSGMRIFGSFFCLMAVGILGTVFDRAPDVPGIFLTSLISFVFSMSVCGFPQKLRA